MRQRSSPLGRSRQQEQKEEREGRTGGEQGQRRRHGKKKLKEKVEEEEEWGNLNCRVGRMRLKRLDWGEGDDGCDFTSGEIKIEVERCLGSSGEAI